MVREGPIEPGELTIKRKRIEAFLASEDLDAVLLSRSGNFSWITCGGRNYLDRATETGVCSVLITPDRVYALASRGDASRIRTEEVSGLEEIEWVEYPWQDDSPYESALRLLHPGARLGADDRLPVTRYVDREIARLRWELTPQECDRYRSLGADVGRALMEVCQQIKSGKTENSIAARCSGHLLSMGIDPIVLLVGVDDRARQFRRPLPTGNRLREYVRITVAARRGGLIACATRAVAVGSILRDLEEYQAGVAGIEVAMIAATRPGISLGTAVKAGLEAYESSGNWHEWDGGDCGGPTGYAWRETLPGPESADPILSSQAFAWSPSLPGVRSEDTVLITAAGPEVLTTSPGWPMGPVEAGGLRMERPRILRV